MKELLLFPPMSSQGSPPVYWPYDLPRAYPGKTLVSVYGFTSKSVPCMFDLATNLVIPEIQEAPWN